MAIKVGDLTAYDVKELAEILKLYPVTVRLYIKTGRLKGQKVGARWYVTDENVKRFLGGAPTPEPPSSGSRASHDR